MRFDDLAAVAALVVEQPLGPGRVAPIAAGRRCADPGRIAELLRQLHQPLVAQLYWTSVSRLFTLIDELERKNCQLDEKAEVEIAPWNRGKSTLWLGNEELIWVFSS